MDGRRMMRDGVKPSCAESGGSVGMKGPWTGTRRFQIQNTPAILNSQETTGFLFFEFSACVAWFSGRGYCMMPDAK